MKRTAAIVGTFCFLVIAPGIVAGLIPWAISGWRWQPPFFDAAVLRWLGGALIIAGVPVPLDSFARFALEGFGTPAPIYPTDRLIVTSLYRHVRNPMYLGVLAVILGQALLLGDIRLIIYGAIVWLATHTFVVVYEEPVLRQRHGTQFSVRKGTALAAAPSALLGHDFTTSRITARKGNNEIHSWFSHSDNSTGRVRSAAHGAPRL
jgi:protein-S-isoprenylcysteine O-methyltransferase Ste14